MIFFLASFSSLFDITPHLWLLPYMNGKNVLRLNYQPLSVNDPMLRDKTGPEIAAKIKPKMCHLY